MSNIFRHTHTTKLTALSSRHSQSALEYMLTYGWAILIIVIVAAALWSFGVFSPSNSASTTIIGFSGLGSVSAVCGANGVFRLQLGDNIGNTINITMINATVNGITNVVRPNATIAPQSAYSFSIPNSCSSSGSRYSITATVIYKEVGAAFPGPYFSTGTVSGVVSSTNWPAYVAFDQGSTEQIPDSSAIDSAKSTVTAAFWIYQIVPIDGSVVNKGWITTPRQWYFIQSAGIFKFGVFNTTNNGNEIAFNPGHWPTGFMFFVGTFSNVSGQFALYVNGNLQGTTNLKGVIGTNNWPIYVLVNGYISNIQIYNSTLNPSQISQLYSEGLGGRPLAGISLLGYWPLNGSFKDFSTYSNNGVVSGSLKFTTNYPVQ